MNKTCKDYEMDLMNKASGEVQYIKDKDALEQHLKGCPTCQKTLKGFLEVDTFAAVTREPSKRFQDKIANLRQRSQQVRPEASLSEGKGIPPPIDTEKIVGLAAGRIFECLKKSGPMPLPMLRQHTGLVDYPFYEAMGWLDREKKIIVRGKPNQPEYAEIRHDLPE